MGASDRRGPRPLWAAESGPDGPFSLGSDSLGRTGAPARHTLDIRAPAPTRNALDRNAPPDDASQRPHSRAPEPGATPPGTLPPDDAVPIVHPLAASTSSNDPNRNRASKRSNRGKLRVSPT